MVSGAILEHKQRSQMESCKSTTLTFLDDVTSSPELALTFIIIIFTVTKAKSN